MTVGHHLGLGSFLLLGLSVTAVAGTVAADRSGRVELAQAQTPEEKKKEEERKKALPKGPPAPPPKAAPAPPPPRIAPPPPPPPKAAPPPPPPPPRALPPPPPPPKTLPPPPPPPKAGPSDSLPKGPPPAPRALEKGPPPGPQKGLPPPDKKGPATPLPPGPPPAAKGVLPPQPGPQGPLPKDSKEKREAPKAVSPGQLPPPKGPVGIGTPPPPQGPQAVAPRRFEDVQKGRQERVEDGGRRTVIQEPGNRVIIKQDNRVIIRHDEVERFRTRPDVRSERRPDGIVATSYARPGGVRVVSEVDASGRLVRRYRRGPNGVEINIIDNRRFIRNLAIGAGIVALGVVVLNLPPPRVTIPRERYIVEYERASDDDIYDALMAPPVEPMERAYALDEIRDNYQLRDRMPRVDLDTINFEFGAWQITPDQYPKLERIARAMLRILRRAPDEVFMIEGHTDAVGSDVDNLSLSDRRASSVADVLTETFGVPPENLVTQGFGKQYLKIDTLAAERLNRRVAVRRITPLMSER